VKGLSGKTKPTEINDGYGVFRVRITVRFSSGMEANIAGIGECTALPPSLPKENCPAIRYNPASVSFLHQSAICKPMMGMANVLKVLHMDPIQAPLQKTIAENAFVLQCKPKSHNGSSIS